MLTLDLKTCLGLEKPDKYYHLEKSTINPATGRAYAINPATGNWDDTYFSEVVEPQFKSTDPASILQAQNEARMKAIQPALESLRASKPETKQAFDIRTGQLAAEKDPLIARYQNLVADLTGREQKALGAQGKALSQLYGQRGIELTSAAYQQDLASKQADISYGYGIQRKDVGLAQEADVRDLENQISGLTTQRVAAMRDIDNRIAEFQATGANQAVTDALTMYREDLNRKFESRFDDLNRQVEQAKLQPSYQAVDLGKGQYSTFNPQTGQYGNVTTLQQQTGGAKKYQVVGGS